MAILLYVFNGGCVQTVMCSYIDIDIGKGITDREQLSPSLPRSGCTICRIFSDAIGPRRARPRTSSFPLRGQVRAYRFKFAICSRVEVTFLWLFICIWITATFFYLFFIRTIRVFCCLKSFDLLSSFDFPSIVRCSETSNSFRFTDNYPSRLVTIRQTKGRIDGRKCLEITDSQFINGTHLDQSWKIRITDK